MLGLERVSEEVLHALIAQDAGKVYRANPNMLPQWTRLAIQERYKQLQEQRMQASLQEPDADDAWMTDDDYR